MKDIFISHSWCKDGLKRNNHTRCKKLADKLIKSGYTVWFDSYDLCGNIDATIMEGINNAKVVLVCLTKKYCDKINNCVSNQVTNDNCYKEWNYSIFKNKIIIPILMEPCMIDIFLTQEGVIQMHLNSMMFINFSKNLNNDFNLLCKNMEKHKVISNIVKKTVNTTIKNIIQEKTVKLLPLNKNKSKKHKNKNYSNNLNKSFRTIIKI